MPGFVTREDWAPIDIPDLEPNADTVARSKQSMCVTAGPGAGKTELLAQRAAFLLQTGACAYPQRILAISFKRDAAKNLRNRVSKRLGADLGRRFDSLTFDAFAKGVVDQFRAALPQMLRPTPEYEILFGLRSEEVDQVLLEMNPPALLGRKEQLREMASAGFFNNDVPKVGFGGDPSSLKEWAAREFWRLLLRRPRSQLSFRMITRLAGELFRRDARVRRAYRATYSHVFLDEFQDTTDLQYWLTSVLFKDTSAVLTAVGDEGQRIMGWAGALSGIFQKFRDDFAAVGMRLQRNHRASDEIAPVVRYLANQFSAARGVEITHEDLLPGPGPPAEACASYWFADEEAEANWIAEQIDALLSAGTEPRQVAVLVRMKTKEYSRYVIGALDDRSRSARIEDDIQDLLTEPIIEACLLALRALACVSPRANWAEFRTLIELDETTQSGAADADRQMQFVRQLLRAAHVRPPDDADNVRQILSDFIEPFLKRVRARHGQYRRGSFYEENLRKFSDAIASFSGTWDEVLDRVEGVTAIPILTIHKSKGLEYDAVFFVGLEEGAFWNFRRNPDEESNAFFVALSRAKKRVAFTFSKIRTVRGRREAQSTKGVMKLYKLMQDAGVQIVEIDSDNA